MNHDYTVAVRQVRGRPVVTITSKSRADGGGLIAASRLLPWLFSNLTSDNRAKTVKRLAAIIVAIMTLDILYPPNGGDALVALIFGMSIVTIRSHWSKQFDAAARFVGSIGEGTFTGPPLEGLLAVRQIITTRLTLLIILLIAAPISVGTSVATGNWISTTIAVGNQLVLAALIAVMYAATSASVGARRKSGLRQKVRAMAGSVLDTVRGVIHPPVPVPVPVSS